MTSVLTKNIFVKWLLWYLKDGPALILSAWANFLRFNAHFFSIFFLLKTLFAPWKRISQSYREGLANLDKNFSIFILNIFSRVFGALVRMITICVGAATQFLVFIGGLLILILWFLLPFLVLAGIIFSLLLLI